MFVDRGTYGCSGYVTQHTDLVEAYKDMDLPPKKPLYTVLLELTKGWFNGPAYDSEKTVQLWFPPSHSAMDHVLDELGAATWAEVSFQCLDCRIPSLIDAVSSANNLAEINRFSQWLDNIPQEKLTEYGVIERQDGQPMLTRQSQEMDMKMEPFWRIVEGVRSSADPRDQGTILFALQEQLGTLPSSEIMG